MSDHQEATKPKILIVEDEAIIALDLKSHLEQMGYRVLAQVNSAEKALELIEQDPPDLVLMDIVLRGKMDGIEAADLIRSQWDIPVVFLTAYADRDRLERAKLVYPFGYIIKPFQDNDLKITVEMARYVSNVDKERRKAEKALKNSESFLSNIIDQSPSPMWISDAQGTLVRLNQACRDLLNISDEEVVGKYNVLKDNIVEEQGFLPLIRRVFEEGETANFEIRYDSSRLKHLHLGHFTFVVLDVKVFPIRDASGRITNAVIQHMNITERKQAEETLRESEEKYRVLFEESTQGILMTDIETRRFLYANPSICRMLGYSIDELLQLSITDIHPKDSLDRLISDFKSQSQGKKPISSTIPCLRKDGTVFYADISGANTKINGRECSVGFFLDITERKQAEESLRISEEKLSKAFRASPDWMAVSTLDEGRLFDVNDTFLKMSGYSPEEIIDHTSTELGFWLNPEERTKGSELLQQKGSLANFEVQIRIKSGEILDMLWSAEVIEHGGQKYIVSVFRDITEQRKKEEELERNYDLQKAINALLRLSLEDASLEKILEKALDLILPIPWLVLELKGAILLVEEDPEVLVMKAQRGLANILQEVCSRVPFGKCICGRSAIKGEIEFADRIDERHDIYYEGMIPHGHYCVPILSSGKVLGVINLYLKEGHPRRQKEEDFLWAFSHSLAGIIIRKQTEKALRSSEEQFRSLFDQGADCVLLMDPSDPTDPIIVDANLAAHAIHGYAPGELLGKPISFLDEPEDRKHILERTNILLSGRHLAGEAQHVRKDGSTFPVEISAQLIQLGGKSYIQAIDRDITERKQGEIIIQDSLDKLRKALGGIIQAIAATVETRDPYTAGHQRRVADLARSIAQEMGLPEDQVDGLRLAGIVHDLGKISVPAEILSKPTKLSNLEFGLIKVHPQISYDILKDIDFPWPVAEIVFQHHERMDGSGYPQGLTGAKILLEARILAVADVVEAIASHRPYRPALGIDAALEEIEKNRGILYDAEAVEICLRLFREKGFGFN